MMRWLMALLALAMVLGPTLGQMHRAVHAGVAQSQTHAGHQSRAAVDADCALDFAAVASQSFSDTCGLDSSADPLSVHSWVLALFEGHGPADCQLLDQANHGLAGPPAASAFVAPPPAELQIAAFAAAPHRIFHAAPLDARGPPSLFSS